MFPEDELHAIARRVCRHDLSRVTNPFLASDVDGEILREAQRAEETAQRAAQAWSYQPPKTVPVTWVDMCVWVFNKFGIRSRK